MDFVPILGMLTLITAIINFVMYVKSGNVNGITTTLSVWFAGVLVVLLVAQTDFADTINVADRPLGSYNFWSHVFIGLTISAMAQFANEIKKAIDNNDSAAKPPLVEENNN